MSLGHRRPDQQLSPGDFSYSWGTDTHAPKRVVDVEIAPNNFRLIDPEDGIIAHANHFNDPDVLGVSEPNNPRRHLSEFRQKRMEALLHKHKPLSVTEIQNILKDHENEPQSLCRHRDETLPEPQHTITKTAIIMDLEEKRIWVTNGQPCKAEFEGFSFI